MSVNTSTALPACGFIEFDFGHVSCPDTAQPDPRRFRRVGQNDQSQPVYELLGQDGEAVGAQRFIVPAEALFESPKSPLEASPAMQHAVRQALGFAGDGGAASIDAIEVPMTAGLGDADRNGAMAIHRTHDPERLRLTNSAYLAAFLHPQPGFAAGVRPARETMAALEAEATVRAYLAKQPYQAFGSVAQVWQAFRETMLSHFGLEPTEHPLHIEHGTLLTLSPEDPDNARLISPGSLFWAFFDHCERQVQLRIMATLQPVRIREPIQLLPVPVDPPSRELVGLPAEPQWDGAPVVVYYTPCFTSAMRKRFTALRAPAADYLEEIHRQLGIA
jgi:hypothetical protein